MPLTRSRPRPCRRSKHALTLTLLGVLAAPAAHALDAAQWRAVAPALQAALECRAAPDTTTAAWKALPREASGGIAPLAPPAPFTVFGLPVREVLVFIDPDGELGASYTTGFTASREAVRKAARLDDDGGRETSMGALALSADDEVRLSCTVMGTYDESDYQEH